MTAIRPRAEMNPNTNPANTSSPENIVTDSTTDLPARQELNPLAKMISEIVGYKKPFEDGKQVTPYIRYDEPSNEISCEDDRLVYLIRLATNADPERIKAVIENREVMRNEIVR